MGSTTAILPASAGFGFILTDRSRLLNSRSPHDARLLRSQASSSAKLPFASNLKGGAWSVCVPVLSNTLHGSGRTKYHQLHAANMAAGQSDGSGKQGTDGLISRLTELWDSLPQEIRSFPWTKVLFSFCQLIFELSWEVAKYLCIPVLAVSSLSEMSYCAHERKMVFIPIPFLAGFAVAAVLKDTAIELSPDLKIFPNQEGGVPGHLLLIVVFFLLLKLLGPHYPYWGRLIIPHFANGGLWRSLFFVFMWYRSLQGTSRSGVSVSHNLGGGEKP